MFFYKTSCCAEGVTILKNTWYQYVYNLDNPRTLTVGNMGVYNNVTDGLLYVSLRGDTTVETAEKTEAGLWVFPPGSISCHIIDRNITVNWLVDTDYMNVNFEERDITEGATHIFIRT